MNPFDAAVGISSIVLAILAIIVSVRLYLLSEAGAKEMRTSANKIESRVAQIGHDFETLYGESWSLVRDSYVRMQEHLYLGTALKAELEAGAKPPSHESGVSREGEVSEGESVHATRLADFLMEAYATQSAGGGQVRAHNLVRAANAAGYSSSDALEILYDVTQVKGVLATSDDKLSPDSIVTAAAHDA